MRHRGDRNRRPNNLQEIVAGSGIFLLKSLFTPKPFAEAIMDCREHCSVGEDWPE